MSLSQTNAITSYTATSSKIYTIGFTYEDPTEVKVRTQEDDGTYSAVTNWDFNGTSQIEFTGTVPTTFDIYRTTDISRSYGTPAYAVFRAGSQLDASDLNQSFELLRRGIEENTANLEKLLFEDHNLFEDAYVNVDGDLMTGNLRLGTSSANNITLNTDGSATYVGKITSAATESGDTATTLTTKGYVDSAAVTNLDYDSTSRELTSSTGTDITLPLVVAGGDSGLLTGDDKTKLDGIESGAQVNVATDLTYTASTRLLESSTGTDVTLPEVAAAGNSGLMTGSDKTKLDGIESGATADQTASEILTAIKTVDGTGSGLDSDLLDGQEGSYYLDYNNFTNAPSNGLWTASGSNVYYNSGDVGIATTDPQHPLSIEGSSTTLGSASTLLNIGNKSFATNSYRLIGFGYTSSSEPPAFIGYQEIVGSGNTYGDLVFGTRNVTTDTVPTERVRITAGGYLKAAHDGSYIGATGTWHELTGTTNNGYTLRATCDNSSPGNHYLGEFKFSASSPNSESAKFLQCLDNAGVKINLDSDGGIHNYQSNDGNLCDEREKKNIVNLESKWDKVKSWELKKFHYNEDADTADLRYGVIAQQVEEHCPEVLCDWVKRRAEDAVLDNVGNVVTPAVTEIIRKGVKEQQMMWMAIKALQEAQDRIETLEQRLTDAGL